MSCYPDNWCVDKSRVSSNTLVLFAHGAGADMQHAFMATIAQGMAVGGVDVVRFNFPYVQQRQLDGTRRPPNRAPELLADFQQQLQLAIELLQPAHIILMGKSMGGRIATMLAADNLPEIVRGIICLGYPFLPKGKTAPRLAALQACRLPVMIYQGERDSFGDQRQLQQWSLPASVQLQWVSDGDHSFQPRKSASVTLAENFTSVISGSLSYIRSLV